MAEVDTAFVMTFIQSEPDLYNEWQRLPEKEKLLATNQPAAARVYSARRKHGDKRTFFVRSDAFGDAGLTGTVEKPTAPPRSAETSLGKAEANVAAARAHGKTLHAFFIANLEGSSPLHIDK